MSGLRLRLPTAGVRGTYGLVRCGGVGVLVLGRDRDGLAKLGRWVSHTAQKNIKEKKRRYLCLALDVPVRERRRVEGDLAEGLCLGEGGERAGHGRQRHDARRGRRLGRVLARHGGGGVNTFDAARLPHTRCLYIQPVPPRLVHRGPPPVVWAPGLCWSRARSVLVHGPSEAELISVLLI